MKVVASAALLMALAAGGAVSSYAAEGAQPEHGAWLEHVCSKDPARRAERAERRTERLTERLQLTDAQKAALKDMNDTRVKLRADHLAQLCASKPDVSTLEQRLAFRQARLEARLADMKIETPKLLAFVNSLDAQQKAEFEKLRSGRHGGGRDREEDHGERQGGDKL